MRGKSTLLRVPLLVSPQSGSWVSCSPSWSDAFAHSREKTWPNFESSPSGNLPRCFFGVSHPWREAALNHSWRGAAQISWSLLFSEGSCPFLDVCAVMSPSRFLSGRSFWLHGSNFKARHYQEVGNVNQSFAFSRAFRRMSVPEEAEKRAFVTLHRTFNVCGPLCFLADSPAWFHLLISQKRHVVIG